MLRDGAGEEKGLGDWRLVMNREYLILFGKDGGGRQEVLLTFGGALAYFAWSGADAHRGSRAPSFLSTIVVTINESA